jgi:hypothetical protein
MAPPEGVLFIYLFLERKGKGFWREVTIER